MAWGKPILRTEPKSVCDPHKPRCCDQPTTGDASISDLRADGFERLSRVETRRSRFARNVMPRR
jgi:hypothetical protein